MATEKEIKAALFKLASVFTKDISQEGIKTYCEMLSDLSSEQLVKSVNRCLLECRFFPTISEIRNNNESEKDAYLSEEFWRVIDNDVTPSSPALNRAFSSVGGRQALHNMKDSQLVYIQKRFVENAKVFLRNEEENNLLIGGGNGKDNIRQISETKKQIR